MTVRPEMDGRKLFVNESGLKSTGLSITDFDNTSLDVPVSEAVISALGRNAFTQLYDEPPTTYKERFFRMCDWLLQPAGHSKVCQRMFRSTEAILQEQRRQMRTNRFLIHPLSNFRWYWDLVMVITLLLTMITLPLELAFYSLEIGHSTPSGKAWLAVHSLADIVFLVDILLNFRTGYIHESTEEVIINGKAVMWHYLTGWFFVDLISSVPFDYLYEAFTGADLAEDTATLLLTLRVLRLTKLLSLLRVLRVARLLRYVHKLEEILDVESKVINMVNLIMIILMFSHWNGCLQYFADVLEYYPDFPETSWIYIDHLQLNTTTVWHKYTRSLWRAMSHMISIGYGTLPPTESLQETWMVLFSMALGATFYALFIANLSGLILTMDASGKKYEEKLSEVKQYMKFRRVPLDVQQQVLEYYEHRYQRKFFDEHSILFQCDMSVPLRQALVMHNCKNLVQKVNFLANAPTDFLYDIILQLQFEVYFPGEVIVQGGKKGDAMYFIEYGRVEVKLPNKQVVNTLIDGAYFGEIALLLDERRVADVVATEVCDVYKLTKKSFNEVLDDYPTMKDLLHDIAQERLQQVRDQTAQRLISHPDENNEF